MTATMPVMYLDESEHGDFLAVGGYYCWGRDVPLIESRWREAKQALGLDPAWPLKWSPQGRVQKALVAEVGVDEVRRHAAAVIRDLPIEVVTIVLQERRGKYRLIIGPGSDGEIKVDVATWQEIYPQGGGVRHFYLRGVEFAVQRFADHAGAIPRELAEPFRLVLDDLNWAGNPGRKIEKLKDKLSRLPEADAWVIRDWMERRLDAAYEAYARWYASGFNPPYDRLGPLRALGFESSFYQCHDTCSDAMQVADFVAGCTGGFVGDLSRGKHGVPQECARILRPRFRITGTIGFGMWGNGLVLWPPNDSLWAAAKEALA